LDTSVLVSALRSDMGASYEVLQAIRYGDIKIALSVSLVMEYEAVALRSNLLPNLTPIDIRAIIDLLCQVAHQQQIFYAWRPFLPDPDDDFLLELALAAGAQFIITHNRRDFAGSESMGIQAITPAQALTMI
jgi:putative PIN family toxin of toxin-antitoxin system